MCEQFIVLNLRCWSFEVGLPNRQLPSDFVILMHPCNLNCVPLMYNKSLILNVAFYFPDAAASYIDCSLRALQTLFII